MVQDRAIERVVHGLRWNTLLELKLGVKVAAPPQIYILQRSCHHHPEPINLNLEPFSFPLLYFVSAPSAGLG